MAQPATYRFQDFNWMARMDGFGVPSDVYYGNILLGVIISEPDGYYIERVMGPLKVQGVQRTPSNKFKSKNLAAQMLHKVWARMRKVGDPYAQT